MFGLGIPEMLIIVAVLVLFFGANKISEIARGMGRFTGEFKKGQREMEEEMKKMDSEVKKMK
jgi:sec-independent protein translocase protein TatA